MTGQYSTMQRMGMVAGAILYFLVGQPVTGVLTFFAGGVGTAIGTLLWVMVPAYLLMLALRG